MLDQLSVCVNAPTKESCASYNQDVKKFQPSMSHDSHMTNHMSCDSHMTHSPGSSRST